MPPKSLESITPSRCKRTKSNHRVQAGNSGRQPAAAGSLVYGFAAHIISKYGISRNRITPVLRFHLRMPQRVDGCQRVNWNLMLNYYRSFFKNHHWQPETHSQYIIKTMPNDDSVVSKNQAVESLRKSVSLIRFKNIIIINNNKNNNIGSRYYQAFSNVRMSKNRLVVRYINQLNVDNHKESRNTVSRSISGPNYKWELFNPLGSQISSNPGAKNKQSIRLIVIKMIQQNLIAENQFGVHSKEFSISIASSFGYDEKLSELSLPKVSHHLESIPLNNTFNSQSIPGNESPFKSPGLRAESHSPDNSLLTIIHIDKTRLALLKSRSAGSGKNKIAYGYQESQPVTNNMLLRKGAARRQGTIRRDFLIFQSSNQAGVKNMDLQPVSNSKLFPDIHHYQKGVTLKKPNEVGGGEAAGSSMNGSSKLVYTHGVENPAAITAKKSQLSSEDVSGQIPKQPEARLHQIDYSNVNLIADRVYKLLEKRIIAEKDRRGLF